MEEDILFEGIHAILESIERVEAINKMTPVYHDLESFISAVISDLKILELDNESDDEW